MKYIDTPAIIVFLVISLSGILQHLFLIDISLGWNWRLIQAILIGFGYDLMNGAIFGLLTLLTPLPFKHRKIIFGALGIFFIGYLFLDYNYVLVFGTHLPFSSYEYIDDGDAFLSSAMSIIFTLEFLILFLFPTVLLCFPLWVSQTDTRYRKILFLRILFTFLIIFTIGGTAASYSNSYVSKNMENPLTSAALQYFYITRDRERELRIVRPLKSLKIIKDLIPGEIPPGKKWTNYPLARIRDSKSCREFTKSEFAKKLCNKLIRPNILIIMLESFRVTEIGVYGSKLGLTPQFDSLAKQGVVFNNFYANGFQTRHGQVATYCSLFPNYGAAVMKRYPRNNYLCLPEVLKNLGYSTSWVYGSDSNFDGQSTFMPKIGFDKIIDEFDFDDSADKIGWGLSDEELFRKLETVLDNENQPFFSSTLTSTNHHPFEVPDEYKLHRGESVKDRFRESIYYTDDMLGKFMNRISSKPWFKNTIIFITADTSSFQPTDKEIKNFEDFVKVRTQIPLLILLGDSLKNKKDDENMFINEPASQVDLAPTIMDLLMKKITVPWVGRSLFTSINNGSLDDNRLRAYTNRPGAYWAVIEEKKRYYKENNSIDHYFGTQNDEEDSLLKEEGSSWHEVIRWVLQENLVWTDI